MTDQTINSFRGVHGFLSNFYETLEPIEYEDFPYPTAEHAFATAKTLHPKLRLEIALAPTPGVAKRLGRKAPLRKGWDEMRLDVMTDILRIKFAQPLMRELLLDTGDEELVEGNHWNDRFWGVDQRSGRGLNWLGKILMEIREDIRKERS